MARIIDDQVNPWGRQQGPDAQRADLWSVDFTLALSGLASVAFDGAPMTSGVALPYVPPKLSSFFARNVSLPDLQVRTEQVRRDSRPYQMPSWDEACEHVRMAFILDCFQPGKAFSPYRSDIYQMLDVWRAVVRAGRGPMSSEFSIQLDTNYRINYAFDVGVTLLRGNSDPQLDFDPNTPADQRVMNDLEVSMKYRLINCWLSSFKLTELNYEAAHVLQIEALFRVEDIKQEPQAAA